MHSPSLSAGAVIGKKGKVVEKIRKETGCRISVLSSVKSPHSEEIIEMKTLGQLKRRAYERLIFDNVYHS
ncbi:hypothetical protein C3L33_02810, partial [Rhododendron williamsianum]